MTVQSEQQLENALIAQLTQLEYERVVIKDEAQLLSNLKKQIERANGLAPLSETEWKQVISFLNAGTVFERAKKLRDQFPVKFDDGSSKHIFFLSHDSTKNHFQVTNQITVDHRDHNGRTSRLPNFKVKLFERENVFSSLLLKTRQFIEKFYTRL